MATVFLTIRGDQLGSFSQLSGHGNGADRAVTLTNARPVGTGAQTYTIRVDQVSPNTTQFKSGQLVTIYDETGNIVMRQTAVQPEKEQGMASGDEHLIFPASRFFIDLAGVTPGTMTYGRSDAAAQTNLGENDGKLDFADTRRDFPCYASGTLIQTPHGPRPVQDLSAGDRVTDVAGNEHVLLWTASRLITLDRADHPQRPVLFRPGSLTHGRTGQAPCRDLLVSPQHRMLIRTPDGTEMLTAAKRLVGQRGVRLACGLPWVTYHALLLGRHAILCANGAAAESFYPGRHILRQLPAFQRLQVLAQCPALLRDPEGGYGATAHPVQPCAHGLPHAPMVA